MNLESPSVALNPTPPRRKAGGASDSQKGYNRVRFPDQLNTRPESITRVWPVILSVRQNSTT